MLGINVHMAKKNREALVAVSKATGLDVNVDRTKYVYGHISGSEWRRKLQYKD
jgi:hypothetical protein